MFSQACNIIIDRDANAPGHGIEVADVLNAIRKIFLPINISRGFIMEELKNDRKIPEEYHLTLFEE